MRAAIIALPFLYASLAHAGSTPLTPVAPAAIDRYLTAQMAKTHIPGLAVAVVRDGQPWKLTAYGQANLELGVAVTPDTAFQIASCTKPLFGLVLMQLVERGLIGLDEPVTHYLPEAPAAWKQIRVRNLVSHTSGLAEPPTRTSDANELMTAAMKLPFAYAPGTRAEYELIDWVVLARIVEKVTRQPIAALMRTALVEPLGLGSTRYANSDEKFPVRGADLVPRRASVYKWTAGTQRIYDYFYPQLTYASGGIYSSVRDLGRLFAAIQAGKLLSPSAYATMWSRTPLVGGGESSFGLGWVVRRYRGHRVVMHSGGPALADFMHFPDDKLSIVVLTNQRALGPYLAEGIADLFLPPPPETPGIADSDPALTARLRRLVVEAAAGQADPALYANAGLAAALREDGPLTFGVYAPLRAMSLLADESKGGQRRRTYRIYFGDKPIDWVFVLDGDGKVVDLDAVRD